ncbi:MAG: outer membrane lipoprotein LolB [Rhodoferax sp.]|nr:outer membrane lipoprotein LolB [Rhodoferax sp.]
MSRPSSRTAGVLAALLALHLSLTGCAHRATVNHDDAAAASWSGRMSLQVGGPSPQAFSAEFELSGSPQAGRLVLLTPLGTTAARLEWTSVSANLQAQGESRQFDSLSTLTQRATGAELPVAALFDWLYGRNSEVPGWTADLSQLGQGRLQALRTDANLPAVVLRIVLQP